MNPPAGPARKLMMTAFGWNDPGGGTTVPRLAAKELARRGWEVTVFHAATQPTASRTPYELTERLEDGVRLIGVHNRPHLLFDFGHPLREIDDPPITRAFAAALDRLRPDVIHFHNLHNLGAALIDHAPVRGIPAYFTTHNYWLICPRAYLLTGTGSICNGPGDGGRCAPCVGSHETQAHQFRLAAIRSKAQSGLTRILAVSRAVRQALVGAGYPPDSVDVVRQAMPHEAEIWASVGRDRVPGRRRERLTVAFIGSAYPHKGPQLLVEAAQRTESDLDVRILGEVREAFAGRLREIDVRGAVSIHGSYEPGEIGSLLGDVDVAVLPSMWWDCAPLAAAECLAARVPLVVPRLGGLPDTIRDGVDGLLFDGLDAADLARQLDRFAREPQLLDRCQANIRPPRAFSVYVDELEQYYRGQRAEPAAFPASTPSVRWKGDHGLPTSLSVINDEVTQRLPYIVQRADRAGHNLDPPLPHPADVEVHHQWPPDLETPQSGRLAAIIPWEFGSIPAQWIPGIRGTVDELWVPSKFVRDMYIDSGIAPDKVHVIPNGVDLEVFSPRPTPPNSSGPTRFLYVGGITERKGLDILVAAWERAFIGREDVVLVVKAATAAGAYGGPTDALRRRAAAAQRPLIELIEDDLDRAHLAELYRSCDVFVLPYRGEGFAMPVLEAMASGLPVITTAGGPTDEFCPEQAAWRIRAVRKDVPAEKLSGYTPEGTPWMFEPDPEHLAELMLRAVAAGPVERERRGKAGRAAAEGYSWAAVAERYASRITALASAPTRRADQVDQPFQLENPRAVRVLATPAWRSDDRLVDLLADWAAGTQSASPACLYLLADPDAAGDPESIESRIRSASVAAGVDLNDCADVEVLLSPFYPERDPSLHAAVHAYVPLHRGCTGHLRLAAAAGNVIAEPSSGALEQFLSASEFS